MLHSNLPGAAADTVETQLVDLASAPVPPEKPPCVSPPHSAEMQRAAFQCKPPNMGSTLELGAKTSFENKEDKEEAKQVTPTSSHSEKVDQQQKQPEDVEPKHVEPEHLAKVELPKHVKPETVEPKKSDEREPQRMKHLPVWKSKANPQSRRHRKRPKQSPQERRQPNDKKKQLQQTMMNFLRVTQRLGCLLVLLLGD